MTSAPVIFGELDKMQSTKGKETIEWTPTVLIGFYVFEPAIASIIYMLGAPRRQRAHKSSVGLVGVASERDQRSILSLTCI